MVIPLIESLGAFAAGLNVAALPEELLDKVALHVFDTIGAGLAGASVAETIDLREIVSAHHGTGAPATALLGSVAARCSEIDDIHLRACITPGSIVVPAALAVAAGRADLDGAGLLSACLAGMEAIIRMGIAVDGPSLLYRDIWPTYLCAPVGAAVATARVLGLDAARTADAIGIAAGLTSGTTGRPPGKTSRWLTIGAAVHNGVLAALGAQRGLRGDARLFDGQWSTTMNVPLDGDALAGGLGERFVMRDACLKPWCAAKQTVAATDAFRQLVMDERLDAREIREIAVSVPAAYKAMIDKPDPPRARGESFASVQYQIALAAFAPDRMWDVVRADALTTPDVVKLMRVTRVVGEPRWAGVYPEAWPGAVTLTMDDGRRFEREIVHPLGDPGTAFGWPEVRAKIVRATGLPETAVAAVEAACRSLPEAASVAPLIGSILSVVA